MAAADLSAVADRLSRAADKAEALAGSADTGGWWQDSDPETVWPGSAGSRIETCNQANAAFIAAFDPHTVAALVPMLRKAVKHCAKARGPMPLSVMWWADLDTFAQRLLGEEEDR